MNIEIFKKLFGFGATNVPGKITPIKVVTRNALNHVSTEQAARSLISGRRVRKMVTQYFFPKLPRF